MDAAREEGRRQVVRPVAGLVLHDLARPDRAVAAHRLLDQAVHLFAAEIAGQEMHVEFISILAQAQKMGNVSSVERFLNEILTVGAQKPEAWDVLNLDRTLKGYGEDLGMDPDEFNADDMIQQIRQQRQQAQQQQAQAAAMAQAANAAKSAAATPMGGDTLLSRITGGGAGPGAPPGSGGGPQGQ